MQRISAKAADGKTILTAPVEADARREKEKIVYTGFIAQDVEKSARELGFDFSGVDAPKNEKDLYGLRYAEFVVPLVKSVQELSAQNKELEKQNDELLKRLEKLEITLSIKK
jgi:trimeric autotransporter adhesin